MEGINPATLSQRLKVLEGEEIIRRKVIPDSRPHVEYELTPKGKDLLRVFQALDRWVGTWYSVEET